MSDSKPLGLLVAADEPALLYPSVDAAERDLEVIDVEDGVYPYAIDFDGYLYDIKTDGAFKTLIIRKRPLVRNESLLRKLLLIVLDKSLSGNASTFSTEFLLMEAKKLK
ncbi:hypothetical protein A4249_01845 [Brevundimonas sp. GW460-12-10-14-LB2]|uniref:hypothetical protein n=1 Tax=Brevundimonas sp. GW460-12-10-14-LB2 TaxID=1827469 RepID=UPI0007BCD7F9|nr:hypothetical protein [Brevundimonas sp. GW460-12-10-14-LB2]ANC52532.1 hypothetical protein A4249_01845 [Brevundimonas sp. GW460-12-10-14-LB2]